MPHLKDEDVKFLKVFYSNTLKGLEMETSGERHLTVV
jgi:hypothetical protein